ncbi:PLD nuclease N-terminal domain-containing protein [Isoptericola cucumis]|uniref:Cardiolipin synthase N-terminal domain-containing protein n=1 Tax=Isoptericola cucumis TaxID=1776856 RepID=A0ABQ2BAB6_9MICO|nr:PLD nuclease N-terminal domain-containing protein [Isoptericola cucumis]GGI11563.1 hypothetical protein GCM10007368_36820 [Isoptericola cucumis]
MFVRVVLPLLVLGLALYALLDLSASKEEDRGGLPRWLWVVIIVLLPVFGALAWIVVKHSSRRAPGSRGGSGRPGRPGGGPRRPSGPIAPDDDPDFLWKLEQDRRRRERGSGSPRPDDGNGTNGTSP